MNDVCKMLMNAIDDEKLADKEYTELEKLVNKSDKWKIRQIKSDEKTHKEELIAIANRYNCNI